MRRRTIDPRYGNTHLDANALDPVDSFREHEIQRFDHYVATLDLQLVMPIGVHAEIQSPKTPTSVVNAMPWVYTVQVTLTEDEKQTRDGVIRLLQGNAKPGRHLADADHIFEAAKYGGRYFITHDKRILSRSRDIEELLGQTLRIVTLAEFNEVCEGLQ